LVAKVNNEFGLVEIDLTVEELDTND
jgi:hypothetical protein